MNGYTYADMLGKTGKNLSFILDGRRMLLRGEPAVPAILMINGEEAPLTAIVNAGDHITFTPARSGEDAAKTLGQLLGEDFSGRVLVNNQEASLDTALRQGDVILTLERGAAPEHPKAAAPAAPVQTACPGGAVSEPAAPAAVYPKPVERPKGVHLILNGTALLLPEKDNGQPYYLMDLLERSGLDFDHLEGPVRLTVNGVESGFSQSVRSGDVITIRCD